MWLPNIFIGTEAETAHRDYLPKSIAQPLWGDCAKGSSDQYIINSGWMLLSLCDEFVQISSFLELKTEFHLIRFVRYLIFCQFMKMTHIAVKDTLYP